jgi:GNAT superfamily N-acetyltransferase
MKIRKAKHTDKNRVLEFCKNTFLWGDYIQDVWDYWIKEGNLFVIEKDTPIGICHAFFSNTEVWIEGIRIDYSVRRQGLASKLVTHVESLAIKKGIQHSFMLIDIRNLPSLYMAKNLNYKVKEIWNFYSLVPESKENNDIKFGNIHKNNSLSHYVKSWRWLPLDNEILKSLVNNKKIIYSDKYGDISFAIITDSEHFEKTLIVTLHTGSEKNNNILISYLQNFGFKHNYNRIQILTKEILSELPNLEHKISFNLMIKSLD